MSAHRKKSKRQSATRPGWPREAITFFVDRSLGLGVANALRAAGVAVEVHQDHFKDDAPDAEWLTEVGRLCWVVLTKDKAIRRKQVEREAVLAADLRIFTSRPHGTVLEKAQTAVHRKRQPKRCSTPQDRGARPIVANPPSP